MPKIRVRLAKLDGFISGLLNEKGILPNMG